MTLCGWTTNYRFETLRATRPTTQIHILELSVCVKSWGFLPKLAFNVQSSLSMTKFCCQILNKCSFVCNKMRVPATPDGKYTIHVAYYSRQYKFHSPNILISPPIPTVVLQITSSSSRKTYKFRPLYLHDCFRLFQILVTRPFTFATCMCMNTSAFVIGHCPDILLSSSLHVRWFPATVISYLLTCYLIRARSRKQQRTSKVWRSYGHKKAY